MIAELHRTQVMNVGGQEDVRCRISDMLEGTREQIEASIMWYKLQGEIAGFTIWDFDTMEEYTECKGDWRIMEKRKVGEWWDKDAWVKSKKV